LAQAVDTLLVMDWLLAAVTNKPPATIAGKRVIEAELLADGGFAYVYRGTLVETGEAVAIRKVLLQDSQAKAAAECERLLLERLPPHVHLMRFMGGEIVAVPDKPETCQAISLFELCPGGTLVARLEEASSAGMWKEENGSSSCCPCLPEMEVLDVLEAIALSLAHLHEAGIVHYDVKSENLMLGMDHKWKLGDFGSASTQTFDLANASRQQVLEAEEFVHGRCTPIYRSPELADVQLRWSITSKVDLFAAGCVLFACLTARHPFPTDSSLANIQARVRFPSKAEESYSGCIVNWVKQLLARRPDDRPMAESLSHEVQYFRKHGCIPQADRDEDRQASRPAPESTAKVASAFEETLRAAAAEAPSWVADFSSFAEEAPPPHLKEEQPEPSAEVAVAPSTSAAAQQPGRIADQQIVALELPADDEAEAAGLSGGVQLESVKLQPSQLNQRPPDGPGGARLPVATERKKLPDTSLAKPAADVAVADQKLQAQEVSSVHKADKRPTPASKHRPRRTRLPCLCSTVRVRD